VSKWLEAHRLILTGSLESDVIPEVMLEVMPRVASGRVTRSGRVLG
jgi:hypothetical protein